MIYNNCSILQICDLEFNGSSPVVLTTGDCSNTVETTYYSQSNCVLPRSSFKVVNVYIDKSYNNNTCEGWFSFNITADLSAYSIQSLSGTVTIDGYPHTVLTNPNVINIVSVQQYASQPPQVIDIEFSFTTTSGCSFEVSASITTENGQDNCGVQPPTEMPFVPSRVSSPEHTYTYSNGCLNIPINFEDGVQSVSFDYTDVNGDAQTFSKCILIQCNENLLCQLTKELSSILTCKVCDIDTDKAFKLYLTYQMLINSIECGNCCTAKELYIKLKNELSNPCGCC